MDQPTLETRHRGLLMMAVICVSIIQLLDVTIANVALPHMQASLGATMDSIHWVLTSFIIAGVLVTPVIGWVSDTFGSRRVFLAAVAGFLLSSMLCGAATSLTQMVLFRIMQGICAAFIGPMAQTILFDINPPSKQAKAMSMWGMVVMIAPITGPMVGGLLTETLNWRWVFYMNLPIGIPTLLLLAWLLPSRPLLSRKLDGIGYFWLAIALVSLQLLLDRGQHKDWFDSWEIILELLIAAAAFWVFVVHTLYTKNPLFPAALLKDSNLVAAFCIMFILGVANVAIVSILPIMFQTVYQYPVFDTGMLLMPRGIGVMLSMMFSNWLMTRIDVRFMISLGYLIASLALFMMSGWSLDMDRGPILYCGFVQGLGLGLIFTPIMIAAFATLPQQYRPDASSLLNLLRNLGGSFGISVIFTLISRNTQTSHADMASNITSYTLANIDPAAMADRFAPAGSALLQLVDAEINRQALMIAYIDNFHAMGFMVLVIAFIPLLLKPIQLNLPARGSEIR